MQFSGRQIRLGDFVNNKNDGHHDGTLDSIEKLIKFWMRMEIRGRDSIIIRLMIAHHKLFLCFIVSPC